MIIVEIWDTILPSCSDQSRKGVGGDIWQQGPAPLRDSASDRILKSLAMVTRIVHLVQQQQECCEAKAAVCKSENQNCPLFLTPQNAARCTAQTLKLHMPQTSVH